MSRRHYPKFNKERGDPPAADHGYQQTAWRAGRNVVRNRVCEDGETPFVPVPVKPPVDIKFVYVAGEDLPWRLPYLPPDHCSRWSTLVGTRVQRSGPPPTS